MLQILGAFGFTPRPQRSNERHEIKT